MKIQIHPLVAVTLVIGGVIVAVVVVNQLSKPPAPPPDSFPKKLALEFAKGAGIVTATALLKAHTASGDVSL